MVYFASDIHLGGGGAERSRKVERRFTEWLDRAGQDAEAIVLAGDIFDFWFEYHRVVPKGFVRTLGKLTELTDRGVRVIFLTGNHDLWVGDYFARECGIEVYTAPQTFEFSGKQIHVAHGDNMNIHRQPALKLLNGIFRSRTLRTIFSRIIHPDLFLRFGHWWSGRSRKSHLAQGPADVSYTESLVEYARAYTNKHPQIDCFVFGHFHCPRDYREGALHTIHLGTWDEQGGVCAVMDDRGEIRLQNSAEL